MTEPMQEAMHDSMPFHAGDRVRKLRELAGYPSVLALAEATGLDRSSLGKYEATGVIPRRSTRIAIALATGARLEWLETGKGPVFNHGAPGLPHLDSNQEPIGFLPGILSAVMPAAWRAHELALAEAA